MRDFKEYVILDNATTVGVGRNIDCRDFRHAILFFGTSGGANLTVRFQGSIGRAVNDMNAPNFAAAQSLSNMWSNVQVIDTQNGGAINGDTGIVLAGTDTFRILEVNTDGLLWLNANLVARTAGAVSVKVALFND